METNNNPRVALSKILVLSEYLQTRCGVPKSVANEISELKQIAEAALAEPVKNCEVGTVKELNVRYNKFCYAHRSPENGCGGCPLNGEPCCELAWAQMPYEEGGAK